MIMNWKILNLTLMSLIIGNINTGCFKPVGNGSSASGSSSLGVSESDTVLSDSTLPTSSLSNTDPFVTGQFGSTFNTSLLDGSDSNQLETAGTNSSSGNLTSGSTSSETINSESSSEVSSTTESPQPSTVFVSSSVFDGNFFTITADDQCQSLAEIALLDGNYRSWMSFIGETAIDRVSSITGELIRVDGLPFSLSLQDLIDGNIINPLKIDEFGNEIIGEVWTSTTDKGILSGDNCINWTNSNPVAMGYYGFSDSVTSSWTNVQRAGTCNMLRHIYCFQVKLGV